MRRALMWWLLCLISMCLDVWATPLAPVPSFRPVALAESDPMLNDGFNAHGYNLLRSDVDREPLTVIRGRSAPLLHRHLPIQMRAQKGEVCRVEVEEFQPLMSMVGHLEPKKFDCSFANGDVTYYHEGNPLTQHDHVQVTIFFFRNNNSVVQTVDIAVNVVDPPEEGEQTADSSVAVNNKSLTGRNANSTGLVEPTARRRVQILRHVNVTSLKPTSDSISPNILRIIYNPLHEECRLTYTSPDYWMTTESDGHESVSFSGVGGGSDSSAAPRFGLPLAAGSAVGGARRWPLFGQLVAFNRSSVPYFDHDCQEALLQGYRYMHRKASSPGTDFIPMQVTIWRRPTNGSRQEQWRQGFFLPVSIANGQPLKRPVARTFRQVNVSHIGGSLSILPRDSISVAHDASPGPEYLDVNLTRMQGPLQAQIVNLRDPTRPVTSFRLADLRSGLVALQLLNYAESLVKVFIITLTVVDPFFQVSEPINLKIATFLQPVVPVSWSGENAARTPTFQVFSLPLFTYTGAVSLVQKHNIQVVGYIDESMVVYTVQPWPYYSPQSHTSRRVEMRTDGSAASNKRSSSLQLDGRPMDGKSFGPQHIASMRVTYVHTGACEPAVERVPLAVTVPSLTAGRMKRSSDATDMWFARRPKSSGRNRLGKRHGGSGRSRRHRRRSKEAEQELQLELSIRIVRLYDRITNGALQSGITLRVPSYSYVCLRAEDLLSSDVLLAARSDLINLAFAVKVAPSQGVLVRRSSVQTLMLLHPDYRLIQTNKLLDNQPSASMVEHVELKIAEERSRLEQAQLSVVWLSDLEWTDVCYVNQRRDRSTDLIGLKQIGRHDFPTVYMNIEIGPPVSYLLMERMDPNVILRVHETASHVVITPLHLNYALEDLAGGQAVLVDGSSNGHTNASSIDQTGPESVIYSIIQPPRFADLGDAPQTEWTHEAGRLVSLSAVTASSHVGDMKLQPGLATSLRDADPPSVIRFTQRQIDDGDIVYVPPTADIGISDRFVTVHYTVSGPGGVQLPDRRIRILLVAEDNQTPTIEVVKTLEVQRDGELQLDSSLLTIHDVDTPRERLTLQFERLPRFGQILIGPIGTDTGEKAFPSNGTQLGVVGKKLPVRLFNEGQVRYRQSGINVKSDDFILTVSDGIQVSQALRVPLIIRPRVLHERKWNQLVNNSVIVPENGTETLYPSAFPALETEDGIDPAALTSDAPQYFLIVFPTKGHLILNGRGKSVSQFSYEDIHKGRLAYRHGPAEIGLKPMYDFARIWDFNAGTTFSLNFTLIPVNSQPPLIKAEAPVQVKEGGRAVINQYTLHASDPDTEDRDILLQIIHAPRWGHIGIADEDVTANATGDVASLPVELGNETHPVGPVGVELKYTLSFTMEAVKQGRVYYVNSRHADGQESLEDVFSVRAYDGALQSPHTVEVNVAIQPTNDEVPQVRLLKHISVTAGSQRILTPYLFSVSDRDVPRDRLQIKFTQLPVYGSLTVYWQHGEKQTITKESPPITESYLGMMNLLYVQNHSLLGAELNSGYRFGSLLTVDHLTVSVSDGRHVVERQAQLLIRPPNVHPPEMRVDPGALDGIVLEGRSWTRLDHTPGGLIIQDNDTAEDDLVLTLVESPKHGVIQRLPRLDGSDGVDVLDLVEDAWDLEEALASEDDASLNRLAAAGSTGGPKAVKTLKQGDRFTKRQIETGRMHYVYTGSYAKQYVYDSCVLRLSDGAFETAAVTLRFRIRNTEGGAGVQTLRYSPSDHLQQQQLRPLQYANMTEAPRRQSSTTKSLMMVNHPKSNTDDIFYKQQMDQSARPETVHVTLEYPSLEARLNEYTFFQPVHLNPENIYSTVGVPKGSVALHTFTLIGEFRSDSTEPVKLIGTVNPLPCSIFLVDARKPSENLTVSTYDRVETGRLALSVRDCQAKIDQTIQLIFKVELADDDDGGLQRQLHPTLYVTVPVKVTKKRRALPHLERTEAVDVLPGTDWKLDSSQLLCSDRDTGPTHLIYTVISHLGPGSTRPLGVLRLTNDQSTVSVFTQYQINTGQLVFTASEGLRMLESDVQVIEVQVFDAGEFAHLMDLQVLLNTSEQAVMVLKTHGTTESNPYLERLQYTFGGPTPTMTIKPIRLIFRPNRLLFETEQMEDPLRLAIQQSPRPNALETILPGRVGFRLTAANLYVPQADTIYRLVDARGAPCELLDLFSNQTTRQFVQQALNQRRVAVIIEGRGNRDTETSDEDRGKLASDTSVQLKFELSNPRLSANKRAYTLKLEWTTIGFTRRVFRVCAQRGILRLAVRRDGSQAALEATSVDAYVGLTSDSAIEDRDFSLHSQKLLTFQTGETQKNILVRLHPAEEKNPGHKKVFHVDLKSPTGAVLDVNRRATVVIRPGLRCKRRPYFSPQQNENPVKRDLAQLDHIKPTSGPTVFDSLSAMHGDADTGPLEPADRNGTGHLEPISLSKTGQMGKPISLTEWLATNQLPDSQTLSASYEQYLINQQADKCVKGWYYFEHRCYRYFASVSAVSWDQAKQQCEHQDAFLASVTSAQHSKWLKNTFQMHQSFWIGLHQRNPGATWIWHNLEHVGYTNWKAGFPVDTRWERRVVRVPVKPTTSSTTLSSGGRAKRPTVAARMDLDAAFRMQNDVDVDVPTVYGHLPRVPVRTSVSEHINSVDKGPRVCVMANSDLLWQNRPCHRTMRAGFVCMKNPEV